MDFEVNGTQYLLAFDSNEESWMLLTPGEDGFHAVAVASDAAVPDNIITVATGGQWRQPMN